MSSNNNIKIIAIVGLPGAGKSEAVDYITEKGYPRVYFGGVILNCIREAGLEVTPENEAIFRNKMRAEEGNDFVAKRIITQIHDLINSGQHHIVADGLYSWTEYKAFKHEFPGEFTVIAVVAPKKLRHHRLASRPIRPLTAEEANLRDWAEIEGLEKGGPIAIADHYIINETSVDDLHNQVEKVLKEIEFIN